MEAKKITSILFLIYSVVLIPFIDLMMGMNNKITAIKFEIVMANATPSLVLERETKRSNGPA